MTEPWHQAPRQPAPYAGPARAPGVPTVPVPAAPRPGPRLQLNADGRPRRPWEVVAAATTALVAGGTMCAWLVLASFAAGRSLAAASQSAAVFDQATGFSHRPLRIAATWLDQLSIGVVPAGVVVSVAVGLAYLLYAYRVFVGRGHARWCGLACWIASLPLLLASQAWVPASLVAGSASVTLALLPRSSAWFNRPRTP